MRFIFRLRNFFDYFEQRVQRIVVQRRFKKIVFDVRRGEQTVSVFPNAITNIQRKCVYNNTSTFIIIIIPMDLLIITTNVTDLR